jgi:hypothetical protein
VNHEFNIPNSRINVFSFISSRFQLHEFTISTQEFSIYFTNSRFQLHEFTISSAQIIFAISTSWIHDANFTNSWFHNPNFTDSALWIHNFNFINWNHEFAKLKAWYQDVPTSLSYSDISYMNSSIICHSYHMLMTNDRIRFVTNKQFPVVNSSAFTFIQHETISEMR